MKQNKVIENLGRRSFNLFNSVTRGILSEVKQQNLIFSLKI